MKNKNKLIWLICGLLILLVVVIFIYCIFNNHIFKIKKQESKNNITETKKKTNQDLEQKSSKDNNKTEDTKDNNETEVNKSEKTNSVQTKSETNTNVKKSNKEINNNNQNKESVTNNSVQQNNVATSSSQNEVKNNSTQEVHIWDQLGITEYEYYNTSKNAVTHATWDSCIADGNKAIEVKIDPITNEFYQEYTNFWCLETLSYSGRTIGYRLNLSK